MKTKIVKRSMIGFGYGGLNIFIALTILMFMKISPPVDVLWINVFATMILGCYFGLAAFIFDIETWSPLKKTVVHFTGSTISFFITASFVGWIPLKPQAFLIMLLFFIIIYVIFWFGFWLYYKRSVETMNDNLQ